MLRRLWIVLSDRLLAITAGGEYRDDRAYHRLCAERIERIQSLCFELGLNCYFETHMNMISEDPAGFVAIMEACPVYFEVNLDVSHYNYRQIKHDQVRFPSCWRFGVVFVVILAGVILVHCDPRCQSCCRVGVSLA